MGALPQRRRNDPTCCLCCHVRTGTIFIGMIYLVLQMMAMLYIGYTIIYGVPNNQVYPKPEMDLLDEDEQRRISDLSVALVITFCMFLVTCMMLCGAMKHRGGYLLPFFCLQLFDFVLSCLTAVGWFTYYPDGDQTQSFPYNKEWLKYNLEQWGVEDYEISSQWLILICIISFLTAMTIKAYCIACVWACYKYILSRENEQITHSEDTEALLGPPAYSTVIKTPPNIPTPPPYQP
ncbi:lysosomal-associated transmembrane protein 4A-like [Ptychodera flava]|uniref:lysosomal-associated transmembrane protein 4A-like n=1 Tax=Ptychodera flava TaxID=63121 RepID=UPI003969E0A3